MNTNKLRVVLNMSRLSVPGKLNKSKMVHAAIGSNTTVFASAAPLLGSLGTAITALETAWTDAQDGGKSLTALMHDREAELDSIMSRVAAYVEGVADGDPAIVHMAGLSIKRSKGATKVSFEVKAGRGSGTIQLRVKAIKGAAYFWEYSIDNATWFDAGSTVQSRTKVDRLNPGTRYWFRYGWVDKDGEHPFSEPITAIVV
jgi:hypothetical protein